MVDLISRALFVDTKRPEAVAHKAETSIFISIVLQEARRRILATIEYSEALTLVGRLKLQLVDLKNLRILTLNHVRL